MDKIIKTTRQTVTTQWTKEQRQPDKQDNTMDNRTKTTRHTVTTQWTKEQRQPDKQ